MHSETEASAILGPHFEMLGALWPAAFGRWESVPARDRKIYTATTRANMIQNYAVERASEVFAHVENVTVCDRRPAGRSFMLVFEGKYCMKFNKQPRGRSCGGIATQTQIEFTKQQPTIAGFPGLATNVVLRYELNEVGSGIKGCDVACPNGDGLHWAIEVPLIAGAEVIDLPTTPATEDAVVVDLSAMQLKNVAPQLRSTVPPADSRLAEDSAGDK